MNWTVKEYKEYMTSENGIKDKSSKYKNKKVKIDGIDFDSKKEAEYYCQLKILKKAGEIKDFGIQPRYELQPKFTKNGVNYRAISYVADFLIENNDGTIDIVDIKGLETQVFKIKKKMFEYKYPELSLKVIK